MVCFSAPACAAASTASPAENLRTGLVNVNDHSNYWELHNPFGGVAGKRSGVGRVGGEHGLMEMTDLRNVAFDLR